MSRTVTTNKEVFCVVYENKLNFKKEEKLG